MDWSLKIMAALSGKLSAFLVKSFGTSIGFKI
jgi:hypothetical protein